MKLLKVLLLATILTLSVNAKADMGFVFGLTTGIPVGSGNAMIGAAIHNSQENNIPKQEANYSAKTQQKISEYVTLTLYSTLLLFLLLVLVNIFYFKRRMKE